MSSSLVRKAISLLLAQSLFATIVAGQQETRPRRTQPAWPAPTASAPIVPTPSLAVVTGPEPTIRVALTTTASSAVISTTGHLMNASGGGSKLVALDTSRVRVDPRLLSPVPANNDETLYRVVVNRAASREEAEEKEKEIQKIAGDDAHAAYDTETKTWSMFLETKLPREEAEEMVARLESAGIDATLEGPPGPSPAAKDSAQVARDTTSNRGSNVRLTSSPRTPSREVVASSSGGSIFSSSAPVSFASDDETNSPVRFTDSPYRV